MRMNQYYKKHKKIRKNPPREYNYRVLSQYGIRSVNGEWARINLPSKPISVAVFRVRGVLIKIRNRESMPLEYGSGPGSCSFLQWLSRWEQKIGFFLIYIYISLQR
jgi:hypothetical protein